MKSERVFMRSKPSHPIFPLPPGVPPLSARISEHHKPIGKSAGDEK